MIYSRERVNEGVVAQLFSLKKASKFVSKLIREYLQRKKEIETHAVRRDDSYFVICRFTLSKGKGRFEYITRRIERHHYDYLATGNQQKLYNEDSPDFLQDAVKCKGCGRIYNRGDALECFDCKTFLY